MPDRYHMEQPDENRLDRSHRQRRIAHPCRIVPPRPPRHCHRPPSGEDSALSGIIPLKADAGDVVGLAAAIKGHDAVVSSVRFSASDPHKLIAAMHQAGVSRYLVVGGAGSLEVAPGVKLIDTPQFPAIYKAEAAAGGVFLICCARSLCWIGAFFRPRRCSCPVSAPGNFASAATSC